jgi:hypothetical protein
MALIYDPIARDQLNEMRLTLGAFYVSAIWAQREYEQKARNAEALELWRQSFPAWDRLFGRPMPNIRSDGADIIAMPSRTTPDQQRCA